MYVLVFWAETKQTSIVEKKYVKYSKTGHVKVLYDGKYHKAHVIKESDSREWLDTLIVSTEGKIDNSAVTPSANTDRSDEDKSEPDTGTATDMNEYTSEVKRKRIQKGKGSKADEKARLKKIEIVAKERDMEILKIRKNFTDESAPSANTHDAAHYDVDKTPSRSCFPKDKRNDITRKKKFVSITADNKIASKRTGSADHSSFKSPINVELASSDNSHDAAHCDVDENPSRSCLTKNKKSNITRNKKFAGIKADNKIASKRTGSADFSSLKSPINPELASSANTHDAAHCNIDETPSRSCFPKYKRNDITKKKKFVGIKADKKIASKRTGSADPRNLKSPINVGLASTANKHDAAYCDVDKTPPRSCFPKYKRNDITRKKKFVGIKADKKIASKRTGSADPSNLQSPINVELASSANKHDAAYCDDDKTPPRSCFSKNKKNDISRKKKFVGIKADNKIASERTASADSCSLGSSISDVELASSANKHDAAYCDVDKTPPRSCFPKYKRNDITRKKKFVGIKADKKIASKRTGSADPRNLKSPINVGLASTANKHDAAYCDVDKTPPRSCFPKYKRNDITRKKKFVGIKADKKIASKRTGSADPSNLQSPINVELASSANKHDAAYCDVDKTPPRSCFSKNKKNDISRKKKFVGINADNKIASERTASGDSCSLGSSISDVELASSVNTHHTTECDVDTISSRSSFPKGKRDVMTRTNDKVDGSLTIVKSKPSSSKKENTAKLFLGKRNSQFKRIFSLNSDSESDVETKKRKIHDNNDVELSDDYEHRVTDMKDDESGIQGSSNEESIKSGTQHNYSDPESDNNDRKEDFLESSFLEMLAKQLPPLTANTVIYLKALGTLLETVYEEMAMKNARRKDKSEISGLSESANLMEMARIGGHSKIELQLNSGIFVDKLELANVLEHKDKPRDMIRRLMRLIVGDAELRGMSATGRGARPGIPPKIRSVVGRFVRKNSAPGSEQLDSAAYKRTLNLMCSTLRAQYKKETNK